MKCDECKQEFGLLLELDNKQLCGHCINLKSNKIKEKTKTLLDEFAMAAMEQIIATSESIYEPALNKTTLQDRWNHLGTCSYGIAQAMMEERKKYEPVE